jgi:hypothetical protein
VRKGRLLLLPAAFLISAALYAGCWLTEPPVYAQSPTPCDPGVIETLTTNLSLKRPTHLQCRWDLPLNYTIDFLDRVASRRGDFATRPTCDATRKSLLYYVTDCFDATCTAGAGSLSCGTRCDGSAWQTTVCGAAAAQGPTNAVQTHAGSGAFAGSSKLTFNSTTGLLTLDSGTIDIDTATPEDFSLSADGTAGLFLEAKSDTFDFFRYGTACTDCDPDGDLTAERTMVLLEDKTQEAYVLIGQKTTAAAPWYFEVSEEVFGTSGRASNASCAPGEYKLWSNTGVGETRFKVCENGSIRNLTGAELVVKASGAPLSAGAVDTLDFGPAFALDEFPTGEVNIEGQVYDIRAYGAVCNGAVSDSTALQDAIDAATFSGGGIVEITGGLSCGLGTTVTLKNNVWLRGAGWSSSKLRLLDGSDVNMLDVSGCTNCAITDLELDGNGTNNTSDLGLGLTAHAISGANWSGLTLARLYIHDTENAGMDLDSPADTLWIDSGSVVNA